MHPACYLFMITTEEPEHSSSVTKGAQSKQCKFTEKRNKTPMALRAHFSSYTPTLYFKALPQTPPYYLHMISYLHYFPWPVTFSSQQFARRNKSFGPAPRGASTALPGTCPARDRPEKGDGPARGERGRPERPVRGFRQASPPSPPLARDRPRQEGEGAAQGEGENRGPHRGRLHRRRSRPCLASPAAAAAALLHPLLARPLATLPRQPIRSRLGPAPANRSPAAGARGGTWRALRGWGATRQAPSRSREQGPPMGAGRRECGWDGEFRSRCCGRVGVDTSR